MPTGLEILEGMEYPGRFIALGKNPAGDVVAVQGITVRTPKFQLRRHEFEKVPGSDIPKHYRVRVEDTDTSVKEDAQAKNLLYNAMFVGPYGITVGNGVQTDNIDELLRMVDPLESLKMGHEGLLYEDDPVYTPRISGTTDGKTAFMGIIKRASDGSAVRNFFQVPLIPGKGFLLPTYNGVNVSPVPSFVGEPIPIELLGEFPEDTANNFYRALAPRIGGKDFRVSISALHTYETPFDTAQIYHRINRQDLEVLN